MKNMGGFYLKNPDIQDKITRANEIYIDLSSGTRINELLARMYPSINDSVGRYIVGMIYKILITYTNYNFYYSQTTINLYHILIIIYINFGIQYLLDFLKNVYIIFSVIENFGIPNIIHFILRHDKQNYSIKNAQYMFFSNKLISTDIEAPYYEKKWNQLKSDALKKFGKTLNKKKRLYSIEEKILHIKRYYYYVSYFYNEDVKKYYEKYGLIFLYFSLYIPDLIYYISDNKNFNKEMNTQSNQRIEIPKRNVSYAKKIQYLFTLTDDEIKKKSIAVIDEFMPNFIDYIKKIEYSNYTIFRDNKNLNIDKLNKNI